MVRGVRPSPRQAARQRPVVTIVRRRGREPLGAPVTRRMLTAFIDDYNHMTMVISARSIPAGQFKARCLALLDEVAERGAELIVTKHGKPVARVVPVEPPPDLEGSIVREGDLVSPTGEAWSAER